MTRVLVTGGAGFIGSHLVDRLLERGYEVRVMDALLPQVHPGGVPGYLNAEAEFVKGDVRDGDLVRRVLRGVDVVAHLAAAVGVGQSMYDIVHYCSVNVMGTASLLEAILKDKVRPRRMIVASSMAVYGEGTYVCATCGPQAPPLRGLSQLVQRCWDVVCPRCGANAEPRPTPESKPINPTSIYAINKRDHEEMVLTIGRSLGIPTVALRFFNAYGPRQALSNPYTGVAAIFSGALANRRAPLVFEDGKQLRDFVHVSDIVGACVLAVEQEDVKDDIFNVGTGRATSLLELIELLKAHLPEARGIKPAVIDRFRAGDIRACTADISRAQEQLGYNPRVSLEQGIADLTSWVATQAAVEGSGRALAELRRHGLVR